MPSKNKRARRGNELEKLRENFVFLFKTDTIN